MSDNATDHSTIVAAAAAHGMTPQQFIDALEPIPGWPNNFDPEGHGRMAGIAGHPHANESLLAGALGRFMDVARRDVATWVEPPSDDQKAPAGILRLADRKIIYVQEPNAWRQ